MDDRQRMRKVWEYIFQQAVTDDSDFFIDLDGDSMAAAALVHHVAEEFGVSLPLFEVFDRPTPAELLAAVRDQLAVG
ncbi:MULTISPECIES: acyl carrier protein [Salinispora]|uniref:Phosphopantetheine-binding n=1 Tax=Salinispora tropica (strain ATCC BAA-916 / DSM 44818 / JCM 13857 / NBRC 105044 / CNB-440) TaxID=369723 RepID=A4X8P6_SALTO|nr:MULTISPECIES: acyl carrier protein [Salinispora]ABP55246.1 phosphopantetheine-binding [Salinispora tropica CNB-440]NYT95635.1 acyl carrier protein [Salinispora sp. H7-4]